MSRLVTGLFYERSEAERAIEALRAQGIRSEDIYLEAEVTPPAMAGRKGGQVGRAERERRFAGLETGLVIGLTVGILAGIGTGFLGDAIAGMMRSVGPENQVSPLLTNPFATAALGALLGLIAGGLIGWVVDFTLTRLGAGPALPAHETLVTVRADEDKLEQVYEALIKTRARHLHLAERAAA